MSVRTLCLAILNRLDATGYEIRKESTEGKFSYFEDASFGSIYPALARLEADGRVTVREEHQPGKPARKVYSITPSGREELISSLCEPQAPDTFRSPFLLIAMHAAALGPEVIRTALDRRKQHLREELKKINECSEDKTDPGVDWIRDYGRSCMTSDLAYLEHHGNELIKIAEGVIPSPKMAAE
ncbi:hypothetical protein GCM10011316_13340 [Roseibium aquae]|uniref:Transcription regulator PadR N-terminal domain-containing protein n=1 Tax=Roseibium aquae TaxID=1323746 RepID=A0A916WZV2_9HYPH|nr:PadR family transcriptional regulator [Roseibium aquae]GGB42768.1 hypothetical protein GCM10011316_13340 [Roseibium aquae]